GVGSGGGRLAFDAVLRDRALTLEDRTAVALMYLPTAQLKAFLSSEEELYAEKGVLDGVLLTGMAQRGLHLMQKYIDRTMDIQTGALVATRSAAFFPPEWRKEKETVHVWAAGYRERLMEWEFMFNAGLFAKHCQRAKAALTKEPLPSEALARLAAIRLRNSRPAVHPATAAPAAEVNNNELPPPASASPPTQRETLA
ncbi:unnamed protein product, partial [Scytosiphon promiscuus]